MTQPVSQKTEDALRVAMKRLLDGTSVHTDGRLNVANLAREAGVSRATANRATAVLWNSVWLRQGFGRVRSRD